MYYSQYTSNLRDLERSLFWLLYDNDIIDQFSCLSPIEKEIIKKHYYQGISFEQIGSSISLTADKTQEMYHLGLTNIIQEVRDYIAQRATLLNDLKENYNLKATIKQLKELLPEADYRKLNYVNLDMHVTAIGEFSVRTINALKGNGIHTLGDLVLYKKRDLLLFRNFGYKSLKELESVLRSYHITLRD